MSALSLLFLASSALAEEALAAGGRSPDGRREVRVIRDPSREPSDYVIQIRDPRRVKPLLILDEVGGWLRYSDAKEECRALWHESGNFVVIADRGGKTSSEIFLIDLSGDSARRISLPDYVQNALGRVDATSTSTTCLSTLKVWHGNRLSLTLHFSIGSPKIGLQRYSTEVVLHLMHGQHVSPYVELAAVSQPTSGW